MIKNFTRVAVITEISISFNITEATGYDINVID